MRQKRPRSLPGKKKRVLILGLGQYPKGSGISAAMFFAKLGAEVTVTDLKKAKDLAGNLSRLKRYRHIRYTLGRHNPADIRRSDLIVANPRVRPDAKELRLARKLGIPVTSDIAVFLEQCPATVIAVTGTRGKSTTSSMIAAMLKESGRCVWLGGNILVSPLTFLSRIRSGDVVVLELSSWQCESLPQNHSPHIAVVTNLLRDHLNTYGGMTDYAEAKAQIFRHQGTKDIVILNSDDSYGKRWAKEAPGIVRTFGKSRSNDALYSARGIRSGSFSIAANDLQLLGEHNISNAAAAVLAAKAASVPSGAIRRALRSFRPLPYRLETVRMYRGVRYVNDTCATTPDGTLAAYNAFKPHSKNMFFILGGADKMLDYCELGRVFRRAKHRLRIFLLPGSASKKIEKELRGCAVRQVRDLADAVISSSGLAKAGDSVILSPGAASFDQFRNEFERGDMFVRLVKRLPRRAARKA